MSAVVSLTQMFRASEFVLVLHSRGSHSWGFRFSCLHPQLEARTSAGAVRGRLLVGKVLPVRNNGMAPLSMAPLSMPDQFRGALPWSGTFYDGSSVTSELAVGQGDHENCPDMFSCVDL